MPDFENIVRLLDIIKSKIEANNEFKKEYNKQLAFDFNILHFFKIGENKISEILSFFLDPYQSHGQGELFLQEFINHFLHEELDLRNARVICEKIIDAKRRIDIYIELETKVIAIENKIWAKDQIKQLDDYATFLERKTNGDYLLVYLNPFGYEPQLHSIHKERLDKLTTSNKFKILSYENDILTLINQWQIKCEADNVSYFLKQFKIYLQTKFFGNKILNMTKNIEDLIYNNLEEVNALLSVYNEIDKIVLNKINSISNILNEAVPWDNYTHFEVHGPFPWDGMRIYKYCVSVMSNTIWIEIIKEKINLRISHYFQEGNDFELDTRARASELRIIQLDREQSNEQIVSLFLEQVNIAVKVLRDFYNQEAIR